MVRVPNVQVFSYWYYGTSESFSENARNGTVTDTTFAQFRATTDRAGIVGPVPCLTDRGMSDEQWRHPPQSRPPFVTSEVTMPHHASLATAACHNSLWICRLEFSSFKMHQLSFSPPHLFHLWTTAVVIISNVSPNGPLTHSVSQTQNQY